MRTKCAKRGCGKFLELNENLLLDEPNNGLTLGGMAVIEAAAASPPQSDCLMTFAEALTRVRTDGCFSTAITLQLLSSLYNVNIYVMTERADLDEHRKCADPRHLILSFPISYHTLSATRK